MNVANYITLGRIILTIILFFIKPLTGLFYTIYIACGLSDIIDGFIARRFKMQTEFGARFDSIADILFATITVVKIFPMLEIELDYMIWIIFILLLKVLCVGIVCMRYTTFGMIHTVMNKIAGFLLFISPLILKLVELKYIVMVLCVVTTIAVLDELAINITSKKLDLNRKGFFDKSN